ncbi:hypothetical protein DNL40_06350 [Xylanimonas oleitrophica]|uniref:Xaa-Pro dipeptidyl-peptidase-like domain-containing protein n=1 Tax=Xylanimonas oleitrophica TaxID=2607479 RepID=A0A2W5WRJ9_9MICO|nr:CocE/NonD family hydrolase [Xylanimonas oleitrophica]PZR53740.1 hypothetical protein DNL40_06350 [Xylanimonas oleitrophica]
MTRPIAESPFSVTAPDGAVLGGTLVHAHGPAHGVVVLRTPYDADQHLPQARSLARRGLDCLVQDVRGRYSSTGDWAPYVGEAEDGVVTLDTLHHHGVRGPVVAYGASYAAHAALELARADRRVRKVVAMVPALGLHETAYAPDGTPQHLDRLGWWAVHGSGRQDHPPLPPAVLHEAAHRARREGPVAAARRLGWDGHRLDAFRRLWQAPALDLSRYADASAELLVVTGDHDSFDGYARRLAAAWGTRSGATRAVVSGPWGHDLGISTPDHALRDTLATAGSPGEAAARWMTGGTTPAPGTELRLDIDSRSWQVLPLPSAPSTMEAHG